MATIASSPSAATTSVTAHFYQPYIQDPTVSTSAIAVQFRKVAPWSRKITQGINPVTDNSMAFVSQGTWRTRTTTLEIYVPDQATSDAVLALLISQKTLFLARPTNDVNSSAASQALYFAVVGEVTEDHANPSKNREDRILTCAIVEQPRPAV